MGTPNVTRHDDPLHDAMHRIADKRYNQPRTRWVALQSACEMMGDDTLQQRICKATSLLIWVLSHASDDRTGLVFTKHIHCDDAAP
jgi:hypothetical protein